MCKPTNPQIVTQQKVFYLILIALQSVSFVYPFSIASQPTSNHDKHNNNILRSVSASATGSKDAATTIAPLLSTLAHSSQLQDQVTYDQESKLVDQQSNLHFHQRDQYQLDDGSVLGAKQQPRSSNQEEHDESVPMATINNHSRNNQQPIRPPQYVDVAALVGRDRNLTSAASSTVGSSMSNSLGLSPVSGSSGASGLTGKSRSGLPECATQQVCNAIFVRMNYTQRLCECSSNYNWKCSNNLDPQDGHTIELTRKFDKRIYTQIKTCEPLREVRACKSPTDWTLLALQSERSGKAHYVVVCKCPTWAQLEGPYTHNHPPYANIPGIRVYGMLCAHQTARSSTAQTYSAYNPALNVYPEFPWSEALNVLNTTNLLSSPTLVDSN